MEKNDSTTKGLSSYCRRMGKILRFSAFGVVGVGILAAAVAMFAEPFFFELFRRMGIDSSKWVEPMLSFFSQSWVHLMIAWMIGFGIGVLAHRAALRYDKRETDSVRLALADKADAMVKLLSELFGEWQAEHSEAWNRDSRANLEELANGLTVPRTDHTSRVDQKFSTKYHNQFDAEASSIIEQAKKIVPVSEHRIWLLSHGIRGAHDLNELKSLLVSISASLRNPVENVPAVADVVRMELKE